MSFNFVYSVGSHCTLLDSSLKSLFAVRPAGREMTYLGVAIGAGQNLLLLLHTGYLTLRQLLADGLRYFIDRWYENIAAAP